MIADLITLTDIMGVEIQGTLFVSASATSMASTSSLPAGEKKPWWVSNKKIVEKYLREAKLLIATRDQTDIAYALNLLDAALAIAPRFEQALELKAKSLLNLRRYKDVADMLQEYIPSVKISGDDTTFSSDSSSTMLCKEQGKLLSSDGDEPSFKCFPVSDLKNKVLAGLFKSSENESPWRYLVLGQACCHLGLMEDALVLLQTSKRLACAAFRRESICWSDDSFFFPFCSGLGIPRNSPAMTESGDISKLLAQIKLLLRRKTAAIAALDTGMYLEAIRHFSKIVDSSRHNVPQTFLAECYMYRASAYRSAGRIAEAIADCSKTLAFDPSCIEALKTRAALLEAIGCFNDSLHDLGHLKLLYNSLLKGRKLPGPAWKRQGIHYTEVEGKLCSLASKMKELAQRISTRELVNVDYYALSGLRRGSSRTELERAHLVLTLRHNSDKSSSFMERCEFVDEYDKDYVKDRANVSAQMLNKIIQKGYNSVMSTIISEEAADGKNRKRATATAQVSQSARAFQMQQGFGKGKINESNGGEYAANEILDHMSAANATTSTLFKGSFCRDLAAAGFNHPIQVKYEALSC